MPFPKVDRVLYNPNALDRVICQLRFPPILRIESELPTSFQEGIREQFPVFRENIEILQEIPSFSGLNLAPNIDLASRKSITNKNYSFSTDDGKWQINLTRTFISLTTTDYLHWGDFKKRFNNPIQALVSEYRPTYFSRIGLRYIDIFDRSKYGLKDVKWNELLSPQFVGLMASPIENEIRNFEGKYEINLEDDESILRVIMTFVNKVNNEEKCFLVDGDFFYPKKISYDLIGDKLDFLHEQAIRLIRLIITDRLHNAMNPKKF